MENKERHILDWLNSIADPTIREQAIANYNPKYDHVVTTEFHLALNEAFEWQGTPQKGAYWNKVYHTAELREVPDGMWQKIEGKWTNLYDEKQPLELKYFGGTSPDHDGPISDLNATPHETIELENAIVTVKAHGYKVMKKVETWEEV